MLDEWTKSRSVLEDVLGHDVAIASLPGGYFSPTVAETAAEAGLRVLFTSEPVTRTGREARVHDHRPLRDPRGSRCRFLSKAGRTRSLDPLGRVGELAGERIAQAGSRSLLFASRRPYRFSPSYVVFGFCGTRKVRHESDEFLGTSCPAVPGPFPQHIGDCHEEETTASLVDVACCDCHRGGQLLEDGSPTSPSGGAELPNATGSVKVSINPSPVPFSGVPVTDDPGCATKTNTWYYDQVFTESSGNAVTLTSRD